MQILEMVKSVVKKGTNFVVYAVFGSILLVYLFSIWLRIIAEKNFFHKKIRTVRTV